MVEPYKAKFIDFLLSRDVLKIGGHFTLKSGRNSPYFLKLDEVSDGVGLIELGDAYAETILANVKPEDFDGIVGIPNKCHTFGPSIAVALARRGQSKLYSSWRAEPKTYGEATSSDHASREQRQREYIIGARIPDGSKQILADDVMTAGDAKAKALEMLKYLAQGVIVPALVIAVSRQEIDDSGENAIAEFARKHDIPVYYPIITSDIFDHLKATDRLSSGDERAFLDYFRAWGLPEVRRKYELESKRLLEGKFVIPSCDLDSLERFEEIVQETADNEKIGGYKLGLEIGLSYGLPATVDIVRKHAARKLVIYDHQKAGTDIADVSMARKFANVAKKAGVDAVILFPQSGPVTQTSWTGEALQAGVEVIIGGHMTHKGYVASEGGYLRDDAPAEIYRRAARHGITNFVVPGNKPQLVKLYRELIEEEGVKDPFLFAPGFIAQGGAISETGKEAGQNFGAIVGRDLMNAKNVKEKARELTAQL